MNSQNETVELVIAEIVEDYPITTAELLEEDFTNDDEAEFLQGVLAIEREIECIIMSDTPEDFLCPDETGLPPALQLLEKLNELKAYKFGARTLARMERRVRGDEETVVKVRITETDKASNPDYKKCSDCLRYFTKKFLPKHTGSPICVKVMSAHNLRPVGSKKKVGGKIYNTCLDLEGLIANSNEYKRNIQNVEELVEEEIEEEQEDPSVSEEIKEEQVEEEVNKYIIKTYRGDDYCGLYECDDETSWNDLFKVLKVYDWAIDEGQYSRVELIRELEDDDEDCIECYNCDDTCYLCNIPLGSVKYNCKNFEEDVCSDCWDGCEGEDSEDDEDKK